MGLAEAMGMTAPTRSLACISPGRNENLDRHVLSVAAGCRRGRCKLVACSTTVQNHGTDIGMDHYTWFWRIYVASRQGMVTGILGRDEGDLGDAGDALRFV